MGFGCALGGLGLKSALAAGLSWLDAVLRRSAAAAVPDRVAAAAHRVAAATHLLLLLLLLRPYLGTGVGWLGQTELLWCLGIPKPANTPRTGCVASPSPPPGMPSPLGSLSASVEQAQLAAMHAQCMHC